MHHTHHGRQNAVPNFTVKVLKISIHLGLGGLIRTWNFDLQFHKQTLLDFLDANPNLISRKLIANLFTCNWESLYRMPPFTPLLIHIHPTESTRDQGTATSTSTAAGIKAQIGDTASSAARFLDSKALVELVEWLNQPI